MRALVVLLAGFALAAAVAHAAEPTPKPGEYIIEKGLGRLQITQAQGKGLAFKLDAVGRNFHTCALEGEIDGGQAMLETYNGERECIVHFVPTAEGIDVSSHESCGIYCGVRAEFDALYLRPAVGCGSQALDAARSDFKRLYRIKQYASALARLSPLPVRCARTLDRNQRTELLDNIAGAQLALGQTAACLRTLAPYAKDADTLPDEEEISGTGWVAEDDTYVGLLRSMQNKLRLCRGEQP